jgi:hypothetical protein
MKGRTKLGIFIILMLTVAAGCAPTNVQQENMAVAQLNRPSLILVYDFAVTPQEVELDTGLSADIMRQYEQHKGETRTAEEIKTGHKVADALAEELVQKIRSFGLWAERGYGAPYGNEKDLLVKGQLLSIDEGNRTERVVVGLGAGRTSVQANVQVYEMTAKGLAEVDALRGSAKSGYKPGMGEMMGLGAITGHLLASTVVSGTLAGVSEMTSATVEADAKRLAEKIAADLGNFFVDQGWIPPDAVKKHSLF